mmetsp:Transcript_203/g.176  ORF Transcript_203/g.176 Transcript_203/m.176 type:complete len:98 (+) Transcript_203:412-705(+)
MVLELPLLPLQVLRTTRYRAAASQRPATAPLFPARVSPQYGSLHGLELARNGPNATIRWADLQHRGARGDVLLLLPAGYEVERAVEEIRDQVPDCAV